MQYDHWAGRNHVLAHGAEEIGAGGRERVRGLFAQGRFEFLRLRKNRAVLVDEATEGTAEALTVNAADQEREMDVAAGFVPGAEGAGSDVLADALGGAAEEREFPIVNDACAVGGEMR